MSLSLTLASFWVVIVTVLAFLPIRYQRLPGGLMLVLAVPLLGFIGMQHGVWPVALALLAIISMFRRPLAYLIRRNKGEET